MSSSDKLQTIIAELVAILLIFNKLKFIFCTFKKGLADKDDKENCYIVYKY